MHHHGVTLVAAIAIATATATATANANANATTNENANGPGDALIALMQRVAADYGNAVQGDIQVDEAGQGRRLELLSETIRLAESAKLSAELVEKLSAIRRRVEIKASPSEIYEACR